MMRQFPNKPVEGASAKPVEAVPIGKLRNRSHRPKCTGIDGKEYRQKPRDFEPTDSYRHLLSPETLAALEEYERNCTRYEEEAEA
jgi:hypothetical protein